MSVEMPMFITRINSNKSVRENFKNLTLEVEGVKFTITRGLEGLIINKISELSEPIRIIPHVTNQIEVS